MKHLNLFIELTRLNNPIGYMLLFWPCLWGLTLVYDFNGEIITYFKYLILFFLGSMIMRSAGCIVNDIVDKEFDKKVQRTKNRPVASGKISVKLAWSYTLTLCFFAFLILINFNLFTIILAIGSIPFAFTYPLMKRFTYWPQFFLGITFNWGIIIGWTSITNNISLEPIILYLSAIFWTLGYDTIYGLQDMRDDEIIGIKSLSIKFKKNVKFFVGTCYCLCIFFILMLPFIMETNKYFLIIASFFIISLIYQIKFFRTNNPKSCLHAFKNNNLTGIFIFLFIFSFTIS